MTSTELGFESGRVVVDVIEAAELEGDSPYVKLRLRDVVQKTSLKKDTHNPKWNETFEFFVENTATEKLTFCVKHQGFFMKKSIGSATVHVRDIVQAPKGLLRRILELNGVDKGLLEVRLRFSPQVKDDLPIFSQTAPHPRSGNL